MPKKTLELADTHNNTIILQVKLNQPNLQTELINEYTQCPAFEEFFKSEMNRGRNENRNLKVFDFQSEQWPEVRAGVRLFRSTVRKQGNKSIETRNPNYFICNRKLSASDLAQAIRKHWCIENTHHHIRDKALLEDDNRIKIKAENMMVIRSFGYNIIQANKNNKAFCSQMERNKLDFDKVLQMKGVNQIRNL